MYINYKLHVCTVLDEYFHLQASLKYRVHTFRALALILTCLSCQNTAGLACTFFYQIDSNGEFKTQTTNPLKLQREKTVCELQYDCTFSLLKKRKKDRLIFFISVTMFKVSISVTKSDVRNSYL
jgi:hypothetical protein